VPDHPPSLKPAGEIPDPQGNNNKVEPSPHNSAGTSSEAVHSGKNEDGYRPSLSPSKLDPSATHSELVTRVLPARAGVERATGSPTNPMEADTFVLRRSSLTAAPTSQNNRAEAAKAPGIQVPSLIHAQLSLNSGSPQSATGETNQPLAKLHDPSPSSPVTVESTGARTADPAPLASSTEGRAALSSPPAPSSSLQSLGGTITLVSPTRLQSLGRKITPVPADSGSFLGQRLHDAMTMDHLESPTNLGQGEIKALADRPGNVPLLSRETGTNQPTLRVGHPDEATGQGQSVTHLIPKVSSASSSTSPTLPSPASGITTDGMTSVAATRAASSEISAGSSSATLAATVLRRAENDPQRMNGENVSLKLDASSDYPILRESTKVDQSPARLHPTITQGPGSTAARRTETPLLRESPLPVSLPRLNRVSAIPTLHRFASVSSSNFVHGSSAHVLAANNSSRSPILTHRAVYAVDQLRRAPQTDLTAPFPQDFKRSYPLIARDVGGPMGVRVPTLPTATSSASGTSQGMKNAEITQLANRVYELLVRRLASERQRRGQ